MLQSSERRLRETGDPQDQRFAKIIANILRIRGKDIPFAETPRQPSEFSQETLVKLKESGYLIYPLSGQSIKTLRIAGRPFKTDWHLNYKEFEALPSRLTQVAIIPSLFYLRNSNNRTLYEQLAQVAQYSAILDREMQGVEAIIGEAPDYIELAFAHFDKTGQYLFGEEVTRTLTMVGSNTALVGPYNAEHGLTVNGWRPIGAGQHLFVAPLVIPR